MTTVYYVDPGDTLPHLFGTYDGGDGSSITMTGLAVTDIEIYKDGGTTQRASDVGYTLLDTDGTDFDGVTGIHGFSIDLSDDTDSGFYSAGPWYHVIVSSVTVDAQTVNFVAFAFRILNLTQLVSDAVAIESEVIVVHSETTAVQSQLLVTDAVVDTIYSDTTLIVTNVAAVDSQLLVTDAVVDTIYSDTTLLVTNVAAVDSQLLVTDAVVDTIYSDTTALVTAVSDLDSALVLTDAVVDTIYSDTTILEARTDLTSAVSDVKSALVVADAVIDTIYSDTTAIEVASGGMYEVVGGWGFDGTSYFWNASLMVNGSIVTSGLSSPALVGVFGNNGETDLSVSESTATAVQTKHSFGGAFTLSTVPTSGNPAFLEVTVVYATNTYTGRLYGWGR